MRKVHGNAKHFAEVTDRMSTKVVEEAKELVLTKKPKEVAQILSQKYDCNFNRQQVIYFDCYFLICY